MLEQSYLCKVDEGARGSPEAGREPAFVDVFFCFRGGMLGGVGEHRGENHGSRGEFPNDTIETNASAAVCWD